MRFVCSSLKTNATTQSFCHSVGITAVNPADGDVKRIPSIYQDENVLLTMHSVNKDYSCLKKNTHTHTPKPLKTGLFD